MFPSSSCWCIRPHMLQLLPELFFVCILCSFLFFWGVLSCFWGLYCVLAAVVFWEAFGGIWCFGGFFGWFSWGPQCKFGKPSVFQITGFALSKYKLAKLSASCRFVILYFGTAHYFRVHYIISCRLGEYFFIYLGFVYYFLYLFLFSLYLFSLFSFSLLLFSLFLFSLFYDI